MVNITLIAACDKNGCIGKDNKLPWNIRSEMEYFLHRVAFTGLVMGKNTCMSLKKPINTAPNYVLTTDKNFKRTGFITVHSVEDLFLKARGRNLFVVGGEKIYNLFLDLYERNPSFNLMVELTKIDIEVKKGDAFFPLDKISTLKGFTESFIKSYSDNHVSWTAYAYYKSKVKN